MITTVWIVIFILTGFALGGSAVRGTQMITEKKKNNRAIEQKVRPVQKPVDPSNFVDDNEKEFMVSTRNFESIKEVFEVIKNSHIFRETLLESSLNLLEQEINNNSITEETVINFVDTYNERIKDNSHGAGHPFYVRISSDIDKDLFSKEFFKKNVLVEPGALNLLNQIDFMNFFGIPVILTHSPKENLRNYCNDNGCHYPLISNIFLFNSSNFMISTDSFDIRGKHYEEYENLLTMWKNIHQLEKELNEYIEKGGEDEEIISTVKTSIQNIQKEGEMIVEDLKKMGQMESKINLDEKGLTLFNKAIEMNNSGYHSLQQENVKMMIEQ